jgi:hypothetical protein
MCTLRKHNDNLHTLTIHKQQNCRNAYQNDESEVLTVNLINTNNLYGPHGKIHIKPESFFERTAKALPLFLLDDEKENKVAAQFFEWKPGPKTT